MMTRKDFVLAAKTVSQIEDPKKREDAARSHAAVFAASNPRFNLDKFLEACNVPRAVKTTFPAVRCIKGN